MVVDREHALLGGQCPEREAGHGLGVTALEADRQAVLDREVEQHVEELGAVLEGAEVCAEVADVEAPQDGPLELGSTLGPGLVEVGVVPEVAHRPREAAVTVQERGSDRDGPVRRLS